MRREWYYPVVIAVLTVVLAVPLEAGRQRKRGKAKPARAGKTGGVTFVITSDKAEYKKTEQIQITLTLKNAGRRPVWVNKRLHVNSKESPVGEREVIVAVTGPGGEEVTFKNGYPVGFPKCDYFTELATGEEVPGERKLRLKRHFTIKDPGEYTISAVYVNAYGAEIGLPAVTGPVAASPIAITVTE